jgi:hypothetical protein
MEKPVKSKLRLDPSLQAFAINNEPGDKTRLLKDESDETSFEPLPA